MYGRVAAAGRLNDGFSKDPILATVHKFILSKCMHGRVAAAGRLNDGFSKDLIHATVHELILSKFLYGRVAAAGRLNDGPRAGSTTGRGQSACHCISIPILEDDRAGVRGTAGVRGHWGVFPL